ncbi:MAG: methylenetetrahydrofolate reductase C-terminal domain-containing protein [Anaerolineae bacterium]
MSLFSPRRYQAPFMPVQRDSFPVQVFTAFEQAIKGALFGCRMCGNCILQETAFVCPMTCPKGLRNGLCGGATPDHCEVDPSRPCTWYVIYHRAERMGRLDKLLEINAPVDGNRVGHETWLDMIKLWFKRKAGPYPWDFVLNRAKFNREWDAFFYALRQPDWWQGDSQYHPPAYTEPLSLLEANLRTGVFTVTAEIAPPLDASPEGLIKKVNMLKPYVTAANFTDNASATCRMNSLASSKLCLDAGLEPVMQLQARDRTRVVIQSDAVGASGLGIRNILCLTGDHHRFGPAPMSMPDQFDMDGVQILWMLRRMRDEGKYIDGREMKVRPRFFLGAAASPFGAPPKFEAIRAEKKINAGAQFIQTQPVFDYNRFIEWLEALDKRNLLDKVYILAGIVPLRSAKAAHFMKDVPGVVLTESDLKRMDAAGDKEAQAEMGVTIALEMIERLKNTPGIHGLHIMAVHWESIVPRLIEEAGLPRPVVRELPRPEVVHEREAVPAS